MVTIFGKDSCPYTQAAREDYERRGLAVEYINVKKNATELERMLTVIPSAIKREVIVEIGRPEDLIIDIQAKLGTDLVVMATHGRQGFRHLMLGSVAERIVRGSRAPVLTVRFFS